MGTRRKARECALQMLFAADVSKTSGDDLTSAYWNEIGETETDEPLRIFSNRLAIGALDKITEVDACIKTRAEHWRIERMAIVDRNVLRLAVYEFLFEDTPHTVVINEALEIARRFSTFEATQFINGILDAIKQDLEKSSTKKSDPSESEKSQVSSV
ncbi:MAG: transcription antitermination factor NusB [Acidobacteria bacterium]|nr:transcription antitermination factor NusB [Acidobacteriota bacterium]MBK8150430.1 transcription antitermination factor NusB [Acidobacteriota bacterium]MBK8809303.1 transcription antitermination factor NusB [Acidobacteriota bacterium]